MIDALRRRFSYADVMATLAVFIALGGSSYAALKITGCDVENGSLTNRDLERNTLGGSRIKESRLGTVKRARNAERLNGLTAARLLVRCREGTVRCPMSVSRPPRARRLRTAPRPLYARALTGGRDRADAYRITTN
jgi:hypothetical protein